MKGINFTIPSPSNNPQITKFLEEMKNAKTIIIMDDGREPKFYDGQTGERLTIEQVKAKGLAK